MAKKKERAADIAVCKSEHLKVTDLMMPRVQDDMVTDPEDVYLHWTSLILLFWDIFPEGAIETEVLQDDGIYLTMSCRIWKNASDDRTRVSSLYRAMYDDDVCATFTSCQSMAIRTALIMCGIGTEIILDEERKRRLERFEKREERANSADEPISSGELFSALAKKTGAVKEVSPKKAASSSDPFEEEGVEAAEKKTEPEDKPKEEPKAEPMVSAEQEKIQEEPVEKPKKRRGRPPKKKAEPVQEEIKIPDVYIIKEEDFEMSRYAKKYAGTPVTELPEAVRKIILMDDTIASERLREEVRAMKK